MSTNEINGIRIDKWLWAARFYKTRQLAAEAVNGGKVHINSQRCKPGKEVKVGDKIVVNKNQYTWEIRVTALDKQRRPSKEAMLLYHEDQSSADKRHALIELHKQQTATNGETQMKPNKKQRRQIHRFKQETI